MISKGEYGHRRVHAHLVIPLASLWLLFAAPALWGAETLDLAVPLPPGETLLAEVGMYRVFWQSYGAEPVAMPVSWSGHFEPRAGISYQDWGSVLERRALLMHSPWHVPPGKTWVDYELALPPERPIRLKFGIAMGPDVARPERSDGVTFSCFLTADGRPQELMRRHQAEARWLDFDFELTPYAGKTVMVRLQVEPGPKNNASFDYSFFGDARIAVGEGTPQRSEILRRLTSTRAYQATARADLANLANRADQGVVPGNLLPYTNRLEQEGPPGGSPTRRTIAAWSMIGRPQPARSTTSASASMTPAACAAVWRRLDGRGQAGREDRRRRAAGRPGC